MDHFGDVGLIGLMHEPPRFKDLQDPADAFILVFSRQRFDRRPRRGGKRGMDERKKGQENGGGEIIGRLP
jgi:hypothetical protein